MILSNIPRKSLFFYPYLFLWLLMGFFFIVFFFIISLILRVVSILFDIFIIDLPRNVSFFINHYTNAVNNSSKSFIVTLICFVVGRVTKENAFICSRFKLANIFISPFDVAFASKNLKYFTEGVSPYQSS